MTTPVIVSTEDLKTYLRIQTNKEVGLLKMLIEDAIGTIEASIGKSLSTAQVTWHDDAKSYQLYAPATSLFLMAVPLDESTVVVKDRSNATVPASSYTIRQDIGMIVAQGAEPGFMSDGQLFDNGPYTITCTAGYGTASDYATKWLPMIRMLVIDFAAFLYQQRTPGARGENASGSSVQYEVDEATGWPKRIAKRIAKLRGPVVTP